MQSQEAIDAYNAMFASGLVPQSELVFISVVLIVAALALWKARTFISQF